MKLCDTLSVYTLDNLHYLISGHSVNYLHPTICSLFRLVLLLQVTLIPYHLVLTIFNDDI